MSHNSVDPSIPPAIAGILQNLSNRPNVESTLVLSRGNGSIICATGSLFTCKRNSVVGRSGSTIRATETTSIDPPSTEAQGNQETGPEADEGAPENKNEMSPAETLALAVFGFVDSAALLGRAVGKSHSDQDSQDAARATLFEFTLAKSGVEQHHLGEDDSTSREDQVQLLRLRTKRQEIIIYPDTNYLCCVVQSVGKQANGAT